MASLKNKEIKVSPQDATILLRILIGSLQMLAYRVTRSWLVHLLRFGEMYVSMQL